MKNKIKLRPKVKKLWCKALRSKKYTQCRGALHKPDGFCCLGVLCDVHRKITKKKGWERYDYQYLKYRDVTGVLPAEVTRWALGADINDTYEIGALKGWNAGNPVVLDRALSEWNDNEEQNFEQIADLIEKYL